MSCVKLVCTLVFCASTTGDAPVTVTVSARLANCSCTLSVAANPTLTTICSRTTVVKPDNW
jgi:hypothetical protein